MQKPANVLSLAAGGAAVAACLVGCANDAGRVEVRSAGAGAVSATPLSADKSRPVDLTTNPFDPPDSKGRVVYSAGLLSDPPPTGQTPAVPAEVALKAATAIDHSDQLQPGQPTLTLRQVQVQDQPEHLGWVITWTGSTPVIRGGVNTTDEDRQQLAASSKCVYIGVVDATTGQYEDSRQICGPK